MKRLDGDGIAMVVSDHGFGPTSSRNIYLNRYLAELALLEYKSSATSRASRLLFPFFQALDRVVRGTLTSDQKRRVAGLFSKVRLKWEGYLTGYDAIDWTRTKAYCSELLAFPQEIWVNLKGRQPQGTVAPGPEYERLLTLITEKVLALRDPITGQPMIRRVLRKEEAYSGPYLDSAPDLILAWWEGDGFSARTSLPEDTGKPVVDVVQAPAVNAEVGFQDFALEFLECAHTIDLQGRGVPRPG